MVHVYDLYYCPKGKLFNKFSNISVPEIATIKWFTFQTVCEFARLKCC